MNGSGKNEDTELECDGYDYKCMEENHWAIVVTTEDKGTVEQRKKYTQEKPFLHFIPWKMIRTKIITFQATLLHDILLLVSELLLNNLATSSWVGHPRNPDRVVDSVTTHMPFFKRAVYQCYQVWRLHSIDDGWMNVYRALERQH
jgi:hypothetical protein